MRVELKIVVWKGNRMFSDYNLLTMEIGGGGGREMLALQSVWAIVPLVCEPCFFIVSVPRG